MVTTLWESVRQSPAMAAAGRFFRFLHALWDQFNRDKVVIRASGLAYSSLLATVPLVAVLFALFSAFGAFDDLKGKVQDLLFNVFLPTHQDQMVSYIDGFIENTKGLGFVGFVVLILTAILLLDNIESNFNDIWHVTTRRKIISKITAYTSVLVFLTILMGVSVTVTARIRAMLFAGTGIELSFLSRLGSWLFPLAASYLAFLLMFLIIPSTKVRFRSAAVGALFTSIAWETAKYLFALSVGQSVRYSTIYGSLATIPIFLIWLYVTWVIVLIGLEVAYTHQNYSALVRDLAGGDACGQARLAQAVKIFTLIAQRFDDRESAPDGNELAVRVHVPLFVADEFTTLFGDAGLVQKVTSGSDVVGYVPATSLDRIRVSDVVRTVFQDGEPSADDPPLDQAIDHVIADFQKAGHEAIGDLDFSEFLKRIPKPGNPE